MELVNFKQLPKASPFVRYQYVLKQPTAPIRERSPVEFLIENNGYAFIDLRETRLHVKCKIAKADGTAVSETEKVALVNLPLQSMWKHVEVYWQNRLVSSSDQYYPYKAILDVLLNYDTTATRSQLQSQLFYKDSAGYMDRPDPTTGENLGLTQRWVHTKDGAEIDLEGPLYADILQQQSLLLNNVPMRIRLTPNNADFSLMSPDGVNYRLIITEAQLWVCHAELNPEVYNDISKKLQKDTAKYLYMKSELFCHTMNAGTPLVRLDNLFQGRVPSQMVVVFVATDAFTGNYTKNPFNFQHVALNYLDVNVNGKSLPRERPMEPDFSNKRYVEAYSLMFGSKWLTNEGNSIEREDYPGGYTIYCINIDPSSQSTFHTPIESYGNVKIEARFAEPLTESVNILVYASFPHTIEIDATRNIL